MKRHLFTILLAFAAFLPLQAQCNLGETAVKLEFKTDFYYGEVNWAIKNKDGSVEYVNEQATDTTLHTYEYCIPDTGCLLFA